MSRLLLAIGVVLALAPGVPAAPPYCSHAAGERGSIGEAASHGCLRMTDGDVTDLARRIQSAGGGVPLLIHQSRLVHRVKQRASRSNRWASSIFRCVPGISRFE